MPISTPAGMRCPYCSGPVVRLWEWGASWLECQSCGCQRPIALLARKRKVAANSSRRAPLRLPAAPKARVPTSRSRRARSRLRSPRPFAASAPGKRAGIRR